MLFPFFAQQVVQTMPLHILPVGKNCYIYVIGKPESLQAACFSLTLLTFHYHQNKKKKKLSKNIIGKD